jgi:hypothetical protein
MSIKETRSMWAWRGILMSDQSGHGHLAAAILARRIPGIRFGPYREDDVPWALCVFLWFVLSLIAYLMFF